MRRWAFLAAALCATVIPSLASAQEQAPFSERGHVVVVLDGLGGFVHQETSYPNTPNTQSTGGNFWGFFPFSPIARVGVHGFVAGGLSVGGGLIYSDTNQGLQLAAGTTFGVVPRIGYAIPFNPVLALWLRGGITYWDTGLSAGGSEWQLAPGGELYLVITPVSHFGITIGPWGEFAVAGKLNEQNLCPGGAGSCQGTSQDIRANFYGGTFGILAEF